MRRDLVYLVQTDTTVGFLSCDAHRLARIKGRPSAKPFLKAIARLRELERIGRVPLRHRAMVRRVEKCSFILPNGRSFRRVSGPHRHFIEKFGCCLTTSANPHGKAFDEAWARGRCDVVVESKEGYRQSAPSSIWRLARTGKVKIR